MMHSQSMALRSVEAFGNWYWQEFKRLAILFLGAALVVCLPPRAEAQSNVTCFPDGNTVKFLMPPNLNGGTDMQDSQGVLLADDFLCTSTGPITDIHIWASWLNNAQGTITNFWLGIYSDVPAATNFTTGMVSNSHPGNLLWSNYFSAPFGTLVVTPIPQVCVTNYSSNANECFFNPSNNVFRGPDTVVWYYSFYPPSPFIQQGTATAPTNYWLAVYAQVQGTNVFGWKTSTSNYNDAAVWTAANANGQPLSGVWHPMTNYLDCFGSNHARVDLALKINTANTNSCCPEGNGVKYIQYPKLTNGIDIVASYTNDPCITYGYVLADDFPCTITGPITDIHIWGSWANDRVDPNATFALGIWSDSPSNSVTMFSQPGMQLWTNIYTSGQYSYCLSNTVSEVFEDFSGISPVDPPCGSSTTTSNLYYYCFTCSNPFIQMGTPTAKTNYWLSVTVQASNYFGWKTSATAYNDEAVLAQNGLSFPQIGSAGWFKISDLGPIAAPVNMAFKINTSTNQCVTPPQLLCTNLTIGCTNLWQPLTPGVIDPCCAGGGQPFQISVQTNSTCPLVVQYGWQYINCQGQSAFCTNLVIVTNATPIIVCTSNTVYCSNSIPNTAPMVIDPCCYNLSLLNSFTNSNGCGKTIFQVWKAQDCSCTNFAVCTQTLTVLPSAPLLLCSNLVLVCGSVIPTNPPAVVDSCCTNVGVSLLSSITNAIGCSNVILQTWQAVDPCCNLTNTCSRTLTIVPPPVQLLCSNLTITCGSVIPTNPPVIAPCCGSVTVTQLSSSTITNGCGRTIYQVWRATDCCANSVVCTQVVNVVAPLGGLIVVPNTNLNTFGNVNSGYPFNFNTHYQQVYASNQFSAMPPGGGYITALGFRVATNSTGFAPTTLTSIGISLSTTAKQPDGLDSILANNIGGDDTVVFSGALTLSSAGNGFDVMIPLTRAFFYNPALGNLMLNVSNSAPGAVSQLDAASAVGDSVSRAEGSSYSSGTSSSIDTLGLVTEFIIGPPLQFLCSNINLTCGSTAPTNPPAYIDLCCSNVTVTLINTITNNPGCSPTLFQNWQAADCCGNVTNCTRTVFISAAPTLLCTNLTISCLSPVPTNPPAFTDLCCTNVTVTMISSNITGTSCSNVISQTWRAVDLCCFTSNTCVRTITVTGVPPTFSVCSNIIVKTCATNVVVTWPTNATSPCSSVTVTSSPPSGTVFPAPSTNSVTLTAWDTCGHTNTCSFTISVSRPLLGILSVTYLNPNVTLHWSDGILQQSTNVAGPYADVPLAVPPAYMTPATNRATFYRLRCTSP